MLVYRDSDISEYGYLSQIIDKTIIIIIVISNFCIYKQFCI